MLAPLDEVQRCEAGHGDWVTGSQLTCPQVPLARQLSEDEQVPHEPPHPSSPHCLPEQEGAQQRPLAAHEPAGHVPQLVTERVVPQLSTPLVAPQVRFSRAQNWGSVSGVQHAPPGAQTGALAPQAPQLATVRCCPHESVPDAAPQVRPR